MPSASSKKKNQAAAVLMGEVQLNPQVIIEQLPVEKGMIAADLGCGAGHYVLPLARLVGEQGKVYAIDILAQPLEIIKSKANLELLYNIITRRVNLEVAGSVKAVMGNDQADLIIISDVLFANRQKTQIIQEAHDNLSPRGTLAIIDWRQVDSPLAPAADLLTDPAEITLLAAQIGFQLKNDLDVGSAHWGKLFEKKQK